MSYTAISMIYTTIVNAFFASFASDIKAMIPGLIEAQIQASIKPGIIALISEAKL